MISSTYPKPLLLEDLEEICERSISWIKEFRHSSFLIAGSTGFMGRWLVESLATLSQEFNLNLDITLLVRDEFSARGKFSHLNGQQLKFFRVEDDSWKQLPYREKLLIVHGATPVQQKANVWNIEEHKIVELTQELINLGSSCNLTPRFIHLSSGAVYKKIGEFGHLTDNRKEENKEGSPAIYGRTKARIEQLVNEATLDGRVIGVNARLFTFYGPIFNLQSPFAISSFISSAITNQEIVITGNAATTRSYLYPTDLIVSILILTTQQMTGFVDIGSTVKTSMLELAHEVSQIWETKVISQCGNELRATQYGPLESFGNQKVTLSAGLKRWQKWLAN